MSSHFHAEQTSSGLRRSSCIGSSMIIGDIYPFPFFNMKLFNFNRWEIPSVRSLVLKLRAFFAGRFRIGWRLAFQDPTPAWKKKGVTQGLGGLVDLILIGSVIALALLNWLS